MFLISIASSFYVKCCVQDAYTLHSIPIAAMPVQPRRLRPLSGFKSHPKYTGHFKESSPPPKTFRNIFTSVKSFCMKFCKFVGNSYPHVSTNFCRFILIFRQMALIFPRLPIVFTLSSFEYSPIK